MLVASDFPNFFISQLELEPEAPVFDFTTHYQEVFDAYLAGDRILRLDSDGFYGTHCVCFPTKYALSYAKHVLAHHLKRPGYADTWFKFWLEENSLSNNISSSVPSAAQHIGEDSTYGHAFVTAPAFKDVIETIVPKPTGKYLRQPTRIDEFCLRDVKSKKRLRLNLSAQLIYSFCDGLSSIKGIEESIFSQVKTDRYMLNQHIRQCLKILTDHQAVEYMRLV